MALCTNLHDWRVDPETEFETCAHCDVVKGWVEPTDTDPDWGTE